MSPAKSPASVMTADGRKLSGQAAVSYVNAREREAAQNRRDTACLDTLSALVEVAGRDLVLRRIARNHGTERAEAAADVLGLAPGAFTEELDRQHQTVRQATRKLSNPTEVPGFGTLDFDPLDFPVVMDLMVVRQLPYTHPQVQEAIGQIIAQRGGAIRPVVGPGG